MSTEQPLSSISEVGVEELTADLERSSLGCQVDIFARFADDQIAKYLTEDEEAIRTIRSRPVEYAVGYALSRSAEYTRRHALNFMALRHWARSAVGPLGVSPAGRPALRPAAVRPYINLLYYY